MKKIFLILLVLFLAIGTSSAEWDDAGSGAGTDDQTAAEVPATDNFTHSDGVDVQTVLEDLDEAIDGGVPTWHTGYAAPPDDTFGDINDYYLNLDTYELYKYDDTVYGVVDLFTGGTASASSEFGTNIADNAYNGNISNFWQADIGDSEDWVQYDLGAGNEAAISHLTISYDWGSFTFKGSTDGTTWINLFTTTEEGEATEHEFYFANDVEYRYYRIDMLANPATPNPYVMDAEGGEFVSVSWQSIGNIMGSMAESVTTEGDITSPLTAPLVLFTGDNDSDNDTIDLQDGTITGQLYTFVAAANIDSDDTLTITYTDTTCTGCSDIVFDSIGDNAQLIWTGTTWVVESASTTEWSVIETNTNAVAGNGYAFGTAGNLTLTLPATPSVSDFVWVLDAYNQATTSTLTVARNGSNIEGVASNLVIDVDGAGMQLAYIDATRGWEIVTEIGAEAADQFYRGTVFNPNGIYAIDTQICLDLGVDAAITISKIEITCDADPATELDIDLKWADAFIGFANATVVDVCDTTNGTTSISSGFDDATIASGKCLYWQFGAEPISAITQFNYKITYTYD